jgi:hypothetical protein
MIRCPRRSRRGSGDDASAVQPNGSTAAARLTPGQTRRAIIMEPPESHAMKEIDEEKLDVLQNIEFGIVEVYRADKSLLDFDVKDAMDALVRHYHTEKE